MRRPKGNTPAAKRAFSLAPEKIRRVGSTQAG